MALLFESIQLSKQEAYAIHLAACPQKNSDISFVNLWGWADVYGLEWAWSDDLVWIRQSRPAEQYWTPVGNWRAVNWGGILKEHFNEPASFVRVPEALLQIWQSEESFHCDAQSSRGHWDYLYSVADLIALKGNRYHKKKNLLNQFKRKNDFRYVPLTSTNIRQAIDMQKDWCTWRDCASQPALDSENQAISKVLTNWDKLNELMGAALLVEEKMVAYTIAEPLSSETLLIHFEKGDSDFKGIYQAINQMFLEKSGHAYTTVNREQDLGNEGLRKAKLSYMPNGFLEKHDVMLSGL